MNGDGRMGTSVSLVLVDIVDDRGNADSCSSGSLVLVKGINAGS